MPLISVIMAVYNAEKTLEASLTSVLTQTFADFELIVVNDASTDKTAEIIEAFANKDRRIKIIVNRKNLGLTKSLNRALLKAQGRYILRQDADDISKKSRFEKQITFLENNPDISVLGTRVEAKGGELKYVTPLTDSGIRKMLAKRNPLIHSSVAIRSNILKKVRYDEAYPLAQDYKLWIDLANQGARFACLPDKLVKFNLSTETLSAEKNLEQRVCGLKARQRGFESGLFAWYQRTHLLKALSATWWAQKRFIGSTWAILLPSLQGGGARYVYTFLQKSKRKYLLIVKNDNDQELSRLQPLAQDIFIYKGKFPFYAVARWLKKHHCFRVFAQGVRAIYLVRVLKIIFIKKLRIVSIFHGYHLAHYRNYFQRSFIGWLEKVLCHLDSGQIFLTKSDRYLAASGCPKKKVITNEINFPEALVKGSRVGLTVVYIGRFAYEKGFDIFLQAIDKINVSSDKQVSFVLKGSGAMFTDAKKRAAHWDNVSLLPYDSKVREFYEEVDVVVFPSRWEGLPLAILEAAGYGVPVLASKVCGNQDLIKHNKTGVLFPKEDSGNLAKIILESNLKKLNLLAKNNRKQLLKTNGDPQRMVQSTENFIDKVID